LSGSIKEYYKVRGVQPLIRRVSCSTKRQQDRAVSGGLVSDHVQTGRVVAYAEFNSGAAHWDQTANRLGLTDPVSLLWEVIPYSFVIDWFVNVGDFLHATGTISGLKRIGINVTTDYRCFSTNTNLLYGGSARRSQWIKSREFTNALPGATIQFSKKPFGEVGNLDRVFSALALSRQFLSGFNTLPVLKGK
jgi:hypothetical protein